MSFSNGVTITKLCVSTFGSNLSCTKFFNFICANNIKTEDQARFADVIKQELTIAWSWAIAEAGPLLLFADLVTKDSTPEYVKANLQSFLTILEHHTSSQDVSVILAVSSGLPHFTEKLSSSLQRSIQFIVKGIENIHITTGFNEKEASEYVASLNRVLEDKTTVTFEHVKHIAGTNPLLLSLLMIVDTQMDIECFMAKYCSLVDGESRKFLIQNSRSLSPSPGTAEQYFLHDEIVKSNPFACIATREEILVKSQLHLYENTWLCKNNVTVLLKDIQPTDEQDPSTNTQKHTSRMILRWNYPMMGTIYITMLDKFVQYTTAEKLDYLCAKEGSIRGFWYELEFFAYYHKRDKYIPVKCINPKDSDTEMPTSVNLHIDKVVDLNGTETELTIGSLYQLKSRFPIIDAVGYLKDLEAGKNWLVFIQLSIQDHKIHRSMFDVFSIPSSRSRNDTIFDYFKQLSPNKSQSTLTESYKSHSTSTESDKSQSTSTESHKSQSTSTKSDRETRSDSSTSNTVSENVLLLYISPKEYFDLKEKGNLPILPKGKKIQGYKTGRQNPLWCVLNRKRSFLFR